jgi:hypothetical protein
VSARAGLLLAAGAVLAHALGACSGDGASAPEGEWVLDRAAMERLAEEGARAPGAEAALGTSVGIARALDARLLLDREGTFLFGLELALEGGLRTHGGSRGTWRREGEGLRLEPRSAWRDGTSLAHPGPAFDAFVEGGRLRVEEGGAVLAWMRRR